MYFLHVHIFVYAYIYTSTFPSILHYDFLCRDSSLTPPISPNTLEIQKPERTLSNVLRTMIKGIPDPEQLPSAEDIDVFPPLEEEPSSDSNNSQESSSSSNSGSPSKVLRRPKKMMSVIDSSTIDSANNEVYNYNYSVHIAPAFHLHI